MYAALSDVRRRLISLEVPSSAAEAVEVSVTGQETEAEAGEAGEAETGEVDWFEQQYVFRW
jgi:hypothetical protein